MVHADGGFPGVVILRLITLGGIALWMTYNGFLGEKERSKGKKKAPLPEVHHAKKDYFSQLPDDILSSILAHLTVKEATRTSILSRRWRYVFASMPKLKLSLDMLGVDPYRHICCPYFQQKFLKVVNQFLQFYLGRKVAHLEMSICIGREFSSEFDQLMHCISRLGVERLQLYFDCGAFIPFKDYYNPDPGKLYKFSLELISRASNLEYLLLYFCIVQPSFGVRLNSLRTLHLVHVMLARGQLEGILSSCLNLNHLSLENCKLPYKLCLSGTVTSVFFIACDGLEEIDLQATNLRRFEYLFNSNKVRFYFSSVPMLELVRIDLCGNASIPYIFGDFARDLPAQVKSLIIKAVNFQVPTEMQIFRNLKKLALLLDNAYYFDIVKISPLLGSCPLLRYLDLVQAWDIRQARGSGTRSPLSPINHTELKEVRFSGFHGTREQIEFVIYILRSAMVLERMFLSPYLIHQYYRCRSGDGTGKKISERERNSIQLELYGHAISWNAVVIIE